MNIEEVHAYCVSFAEVTEEFPFDDTSLVFKVNGKMFLLLPLDAEERFVLVKCDPELAIEQRERYEAVYPGYHMNKKYWNMIFLESDMPDAEIRRAIKHSYQKVVEKMPAKDRLRLLKTLEQ